MKCMIQKCILNYTTNNCKPAQNFDFRKTELSFSCIQFEKNFHMGSLFSLDRKMELIACLQFYVVIKMEVLSFCEKPNKTWQTAVKTFNKNQNVPTRTHKKSQILLHRFLDEYTQFSTPSQSHPLFDTGSEISKILGRGSNF